MPSLMWLDGAYLILVTDLEGSDGLDGGRLLTSFPGGIGGLAPSWRNG